MFGERTGGDRVKLYIQKLWETPLLSICFRRQNSTNGLDVKAQTVDQVHMNKTAAIWKPIDQC